MTKALDNLHDLHLDVQSFYPEQEVQGRDVGAKLNRDRRHRRRSTQRHYLNLLGVANAARYLEQLPAAGESIHGVMRGNFYAFDFVAAVRDLARPAKLLELNIATLGFNTQNADALVAMLDAGEPRRCTFVCSHFYRTSEGDVYDRLHHALTSRGHACAAVRCHAKLLLFEFDDGRCIVNESSANLRSCNNVEQFCLTQDRRLLLFHREWMQTLIEGGDA